MPTSSVSTTCAQHPLNPIATTATSNTTPALLLEGVVPLAMLPDVPALQTG